MRKTTRLIKQLESCPSGKKGWREFEETCIKILLYLFESSLGKPKIQPRSYSGIDRRDAIFPNRHSTGNTGWAHIYRELDARLIPFEFKNYGSLHIGKDEVIQTSSYLRKPMGRFAILCCNKLPNRAAHIKRNTIFSEEGKVILFLTKEHLKEMVFIKERGEDPTDLIIDLIEWFYIQYE
jgi:hypothetical protein